MKRRFAYKKEDNYKELRIDESFFKGYAVYLKYNNVENPLVVNNGKEDLCIRDNGYEWIEVYPENEKYALTIMYDNKGNLIEWYFDISKEVGIEDGIPYEDDLYLDLVISPKGYHLVLDEDELLEANKNGDISELDVKDAYNTLSLVKDKYVNNMDELNKLTDYLLKRFK
jgi:predicted RNA-binding protein associated with RNAse of E/G family